MRMEHKTDWIKSHEQMVEETEEYNMLLIKNYVK